MSKTMNPIQKWGNIFFELQGHISLMALKDVASTIPHVNQFPN
jgi:hypothetical protein